MLVLLACMALLLFHAGDLPPRGARLPLRGCEARRWLWLVARTVFALMTLAALTWLLRAYLEPRIAAAFKDRRWSREPDRRRSRCLS